MYLGGGFDIIKVFLHLEFLGFVHLQEGDVAQALPRGDLYYVLAVHAGAAFLLHFPGLTIELFIFPDSAIWNFYQCVRLGPGSTFIFGFGKVEF